MEAVTRVATTGGDMEHAEFDRSKQGLLNSILTALRPRSTRLAAWPVRHKIGSYMATLSRKEITDALTRLGQLASERGDSVELLLVGGSIMVLLFETRESTKDVDAVILHPRDASLVRQLAQAVARENEWPEDWLNDAVKGFLVGTGQAEVVFASAGITAWRPSLEQLLALKLCAWRDDVDIADARRLLQELPGAYNEVWQRVSVHLQPGRELKARYAFDDLWEENRGPASTTG